MLRRRTRERKWAAAFAADILAGCDELFAVYGGEELNLPITIPIDRAGVVLLQPGGPLDAPRVPATMAVTRPAAGACEIRVERVDGGGMVIPGLGESPLPALAVTVTAAGLDIGPGSLPLDEQVAGALATALILTIGMKLAKAGGADGYR